MQDYKGSFVFNQEFFNAIKAPDYRVELAVADAPSDSVFLPGGEYQLMWGDELGVWHTFASVGAEIELNTVTGAGDGITLETKVMIPVARRIARIRGHIVPEAYKDDFIPLDVLGQDGNIHNLEGWENIGGGKVQAIMESLTSHPEEGGEPTTYGNRFGLIYRPAGSAVPPEPLALMMFPSYAVDYTHIYVNAVDEDWPTLWEQFSEKNLWPPQNVDLTALHREPGRFSCGKIGKHILFRVL